MAFILQELQGSHKSPNSNIYMKLLGEVIYCKGLCADNTQICFSILNDPSDGLKTVYCGCECLNGNNRL